MGRVERDARTLLYVLSALPMGTIGFTLIVTGWSVGFGLIVTPLVLGVAIALRVGVGGLAVAEAWLARSLVGATARPRVLTPRRERGMWRWAAGLLAEPAFWRRQGFLMLRFFAGGAIASFELSVLTAGLWAVTLPLSYRWGALRIGSWHLHSFGLALAGVPLGLTVLAAGIWFLRPLREISRLLADGLLSEHDAQVTARGAAIPTPAMPSVRRRQHLQALATLAVLLAGIATLQTVIWAATGGGYFWPIWAIISLGMPVLGYTWIVLVLERPELLTRLRIRRGLAIHGGLSALLAVYLVLVWAITAGGSFWPVWPILVLLTALVWHVIADTIRSIRSGPLAERIAVLETTRAGAVDQQELQLRQIERDLHDGAQARLVALGMSIGMAQQKLTSDPVAARELLADARAGAREALVELRDLARGIHPPVLADRGLEAAVTALAQRTPLRIDVHADITRRPAPAVETAAYFVAAEAMANAGKHAHANHIDVTLRREVANLVVEVRDDGVGGANPGGSGLTGLQRRVLALDGSLTIDSPIGGPTVVRAVMPCGS